MTTPLPAMPQIDFEGIGPAVGERFPDVVLPDQNGHPVDLQAARAGRRALVLFHRSAAWWPYCKSQLVELQRALPDYERSGIAVFAISYDSVDVLAGFAAKHDITYPLLADEGSVAIRRLGLLNERVFEQHAAFGIPRRDQAFGVPYPGTFILDEQGIVVERRFLQSYRERETGAALLEQAFGIESSAHGSEGRAAGPGLAARAYLDAPTYRLFQRRWLTVELQIEPGLHVYGRPIPEGYIPLEIVVAPLEGLVVGAPQGPAPRPFRMTGLPEPFVVFEGRATFRLPLTFNKKPGESGGDTTLAVSIRYQACSEGDCLMPDSLTFELPIQAENLVDLDR